MPTTIEAQGRTIDEAIQVALNQLGTSRDKVDIEIVHHPRAGFLGLGARRAKVRATVREGVMLDGEEFDMSASSDLSEKPRRRRRRGGRGRGTRPDGTPEPQRPEEPREQREQRGRRPAEGASPRPEASPRDSQRGRQRGRDEQRPRGRDDQRPREGQGRDGSTAGREGAAARESQPRENQPPREGQVREAQPAREESRRDERSGRDEQRGGRGRDRRGGRGQGAEGRDRRGGGRGGDQPRSSERDPQTGEPAREFDRQPDQERRPEPDRTRERAEGEARPREWSRADESQPSPSQDRDQPRDRSSSFEAGPAASVSSPASESRAPSVSAEPLDLEQTRDRALQIVGDLMQRMGFPSDVTAEIDETVGEVVVSVRADSEGLLIGRRGQTLDSLEHIVNRMVMRGEGSGDGRVLLDIGDYRRRRREALVDLAQRLRGRAIGEQRTVQVSPMSPRDRKFFQQALMNDSAVEVRALGAGFYRRMIVAPAGMSAAAMAEAEATGSIDEDEGSEDLVESGGGEES